MKEIKCPSCGKQFTIDEGGYLEIVNQVKDEQFNKELKVREESLRKQFEKDSEILKIKEDQQINELNSKIKELQQTLSLLDERKKSDIKEALSEKEMENFKLKENVESLSKKMKQMEEDFNSKLKNEVELAVSRTKQADSDELNKIKEEKTKLAYDLEGANKDKILEINNLKERHAVEIRQKEEQISYYKDLKTRLSTKLVGESLEVHCMNQFNQIRMTAFPNAYFEKDNDVSSGNKGDFIFKDFIDSDHPYISIMFEMKNENDTTATKHKNEDFFDKLDKDRKEKGCEYAVLVSLLEADSELYNAGIVDVSYKYPKMYVIRPQCFIPMISLLRNAALNSMQYQKELIAIKNQNLDIENFESKLRAAQDGFERNYLLANNKFVDAIKKIDQTIDYLNKVKDDLLGTDKNLRLANEKLQGVTIKSLTKNNPTMKALFDEVKAKEIVDKTED